MVTWNDGACMVQLFMYILYVPITFKTYILKFRLTVFDVTRSFRNPTKCWSDALGTDLIILLSSQLKIILF